MSNVASLLVVIVMLVVGQVSIFYCVNKLHDRSDIIAAGVAQGVGLSAKHRMMLLFNTFLPVHYMASVYAGLFGIGVLLFARTIDDPLIQAFGYLIGVYGIVSFAGMMILGTLYILHLISTVRQAEAD